LIDNDADAERNQSIQIRQRIKRALQSYLKDHAEEDLDEEEDYDDYDDEYY
jgi:hypothetical protein